MDYLQTNDPEMKRLLEKSEQHKKEIAREMSVLKEKTTSTLQNALVIGGTLALVYYLVSGEGGKKKKKAKTYGEGDAHTSDEPMNPLFQLPEKMMNVAGVYLLEQVRNQLAKWIAEQNK